MTRAERHLFKAWHNFNSGIWKYNLLAGNNFINWAVFFFGVSGFKFITTYSKQAHMYQKFHFLTAVLTYKVISTFVVIGSFQFDNLTDQSSVKRGRTQIVQGPLQALPLSPVCGPFESKSLNNRTHTKSLFAGSYRHGYIHGNLLHSCFHDQLQLLRYGQWKRVEIRRVGVRSYCRS